MSEPGFLPTPARDNEHPSPSSSRNNSQSSSASERIIVDPAALIPVNAFRPSTSAIKPPETPVKSSTTAVTVKSATSGNLNHHHAHTHTCTSTCRRVATTEEFTKCGYIAQPVSFYRNKAVYGNPTPSKVQAMDWMKSRFQSDARKPSRVWYHHPDYCEGYPCRGDILYCPVLDKCFFKERCVKHYAMRSRERCVPFNDGLQSDSYLNSNSTAASTNEPEPQSTSTPTHQAGPEILSRKRQLSINDLLSGNGNGDGNGTKRVRKVISYAESEEEETEEESSEDTILSIKYDTPKPKDVPMYNKHIPFPTPPSLPLNNLADPLSFDHAHHPEQTLLTPSSQDNIGQYHSFSRNMDEDSEDQEADNTMAMMWKRMYTQTKDQLDATTVRLLEVQDDLAIEKEKRIELEIREKKWKKQVSHLKQQLNEANSSRMN
ncbi:hypothetical protein L486_05420 [Kwoniella mangroviensis CBS 10435]|uniref:Uncharacterized protein n=1 Tax=Kwoniella mangroviensis CBS 10435 TaxID=1331196 RepID=A0A1B9IMI2_9TREE|nr:hypothetical protein L486_05420 [Kwoniella mangroviensis CBS 10435]